MKKMILIIILLFSTLFFLNCKRPHSFEDRNDPPGKGHMMGFQDGWGHMMGRNMEKMKEFCRLDDQQIAKMEKINESYRPQFESLREKIYPKKKELRDILISDNVDMAKVRELLVEISGIEVENRIIAIQNALEIEKILTPDQRKIMREKFREMKGLEKGK